MIHTIQLGVASEQSLDFWAERLSSKGCTSERGAGSLTFEDYDGLRFELVVADDGNPPLRAEHPEVPAEHAIL
jgi:glyoxalase family protein